MKAQVENIEAIESLTASIKGLKKVERVRAIKEIAFNLHSYLKTLGYKQVERNFLKSFLEVDNERTQQRLLKDVLSVLFSNNKISESKKTKTYKSFGRKELYSHDYESYKALMDRNGYKSYCYKFGYDKNDRKPIKKFLGCRGINQVESDLIGSSDLIESKSNKSRKNQGCFSDTSLSIKRVNRKHDIKTYTIL